MTRHVADHHAGAVARHPEKVIEVTPYALGWNDTSGDLGLGSYDTGLRQQLHLEVVSEIHLLEKPLLLDGGPHEPRILNRRTDLRRDRRHQLLVARAVRLSRPAIRQVHHAEWLAAGGGRPHDRHGEHLTAPVWTLGLAFHHTGLDDGRVLRPEYA